MLDILTILILFLIFYIGSFIVNVLLHRNDLGPFNSIVNAIAFVGVFVHESSHFVMCLIVGVKPTGFKVRYKDEKTGITAPHGSVTHNKRGATFLQNALISLAPLIIMFFLFFWSLSLAFDSNLDPFLRILAGLLCVSLFLGLEPSITDLRIILSTFKRDPRYSLYQIFLVTFSGIFIWFLLFHFEITLPFDFIYFILVGFGYFALKYTFRGINKLIYLLHSEKSKPRIKYKAFTRRRFKPTKPHKEAQW